MSFDGIASGMETDEIIQQLMEIERQSIEREEARLEEVESEKEIWQDINQNLTAFEDGLDELADPDTFQAREAISGNEDVLTAEVEPEADPVTYTDITVEELAQSTLESAQVQIEDPDETLSEMDFDGSMTIEAGDDELEVDDGMTLNEIIDEIEHDLEGATARNITGNLVIEGTQTGEENAVEVEGSLADELDINTERTAQDSEFYVDGVEINSSENTDVEIDEGVYVDLHGTTEGDYESFNLEVEHNTDRAVEVMSELVEDYNELQNQLNNVSGEEGELSGDGTVRRLQNNLRRAVMSPVEGLDGEIMSVSDIEDDSEAAIEIDADGVNFDGTMSFNENLFAEQLEENPEEIQELFTRDDEDVTGVAHRFQQDIQSFVENDGIIDNREDRLDSSMDRIQDSIDREERRMERREERLREQFTQMELAIHESQQQQQEIGQMSQQLGATSLSDMMM